ncbi:MAG: methyltransferase domain-containing protein [Spirochaetales bacterium]|nr:methyltransferase domain-containing protein [Spirochaetales bacterium]
MSKFFFPDVRERLDQEELMDRPDVSLEKLERTIRQFDLLNRLFSAAVPQFRRFILPRLLLEPDRVWTFLDLGAGGGDIDRALVRLCRKLGLKVRFIALDLDERILPWARQLCSAYPEIEVVRGSAFDLSLYRESTSPLGGPPDWILSNHMLHHLSYPDVLRVVQESEATATFGYLLNDLRRSSWAHAGYTIFTGLFIHRSLAFIDGRLSIRRGFTPAELLQALTSLDPRVRPQVRTAEPARVVLWREK